jgi:hypothetical protein
MHIYRECSIMSWRIAVAISFECAQETDQDTHICAWSTGRSSMNQCGDCLLCNGYSEHGKESNMGCQDILTGDGRKVELRNGDVWELCCQSTEALVLYLLDAF